MGETKGEAAANAPKAAAALAVEFPPRSPAKPASSCVDLSAGVLQQIASGSDAEVPQYTRDDATHWIMHLGLGGFSRSHLAMLTDDVMSRLLQQPESPSHSGSARPKWGMCGVGLMPWDTKLRDALAKQDYLYTILTRDSEAGDTARVIGSIMDYVHVPDNPQAALDRFADPSTAIVSLTVTEKGYCLDGTGGLDVKNKLIAHDLAPGGLDAPQSAPGLVVAALRLRRERGVPPFTVLSCDNLPMNGRVARGAVLAFATLLDPAFANWISSSVMFPSSMVDRITPMTTPKEIAVVKDEFGIVDEWPVVAEPFVQWVVEDCFSGLRPPWETCEGVQFVSDVQPYELMKLRLLNSSHSALAYTGYLAGHRLVHDAMADPLIRGFIGRYMAAVAPTVPMVPGVNLSEYQATLVRRFSNSRISDTLARLASDGSVKWCSTLALGGLAHSALGAMQFAGHRDLMSDPPLFTKYVQTADDLEKIQKWRREHSAWRKRTGKGAKGEFGANVTFANEARKAEPPPADVALALAAWVRFMTGVDEVGAPIKLEDPLTDKLQPLAVAATSKACIDQTALRKFLCTALGDAAASWPELTSSVSRWLTAIKTRGMHMALAEALAESPVQEMAGGGGVDLAMAPGSSTVGRAAVLKLRKSKLEAELQMVEALLALAEAEAAEESKENSQALPPGSQLLGARHRGRNRTGSIDSQKNERSRSVSKEHAMMKTVSSLVDMQKASKISRELSP